MYACQECGRKFKTIAAAERAVDRGCPNCGGSDIDLDNRTRPTTSTAGTKTAATVSKV